MVPLTFGGGIRVHHPYSLLNITFEKTLCTSEKTAKNDTVLRFKRETHTQPAIHIFYPLKE